VAGSNDVDKVVHSQWMDQEDDVHVGSHVLSEVLDPRGRGNTFPPSWMTLLLIAMISEQQNDFYG